MNDKSIEDIISDLVCTKSKDNEQSKTAFYDFTHKDLYRFCLILTKKVEFADDLLHDTYIKAFRNIGGLKNKSLCGAWLKTIAKNLHLDLVKKSSTKNEINIFNDDSLMSSPGEVVSKFDVISTLEKLSDKFRIAIYLVDMEGMSYLEAAGIVDITEQAMKTRVHRARKSFIDEYNAAITGSVESLKR